MIIGEYSRDEVEVNILQKSPSLRRIIVLVFYRSYFNFVYFFVPNLYKTVASRHFVNLFLLLYSPVGEYKGMSRHIGPITTSDFLCSLV